MTDDCEEWGPWIEHGCKGFPVAVGTDLYREFDREFTILDRQWTEPTRYARGPLRAAEILSWDGTERWKGYQVPQVIRYRIRRPKALRNLVEMVETLPAPVRIPEGVA